MQFLREQHFQHHHQTVNLTRANLCELVAMKMLRKYDEEKSGRPGLLLLANILVAPFQPFQNAPPEVSPRRRESRWLMQGDYQGKLTALEVAIISESKVFLSSSASQKIIDAVYRGRIVYTVSMACLRCCILLTTCSLRHFWTSFPTITNTSRFRFTTRAKHPF